jgi:hypothetical protein
MSSGRLPTPSLAKIAFVWSRTVCREIHSDAAISSIASPRSSSSVTWRSRGDSSYSSTMIGASSAAGRFENDGRAFRTAVALAQPSGSDEQPAARFEANP